MNDNLDDWLNSIGIPIDPEVRENVPAAPEEPTTAPDPQPQSLTEEDFDDILEDFGFTRPEDANAEEIQEEEREEGEEEENTEEYDENGGEGRDLDAEEDADWQRAIDSGRIIEVDSNDRVYTTNSDGQRVYLHNEVIDAVLEQTAIEVHQAIMGASDQRESLIPLNSPTLLMDESTTRFSGAEWFNEIQKKSIIIGGCGGIGSNMAFQLARMHPAGLYLYDDDTVETVNMAGQLFSRNDVGKSKVAAISDIRLSSY